MPTEVLRAPYASAYATALPALTAARISAESAIMNTASVKHLLRASDGFDAAAGWICRKTGKVAGAKRNDTLPTRLTSGDEVTAYNGQAVLKFGASANFNGAMQLNDGFVTDGDYSLILVGHAPKSASHQVFLADDQTTLSTSFRQLANTVEGSTLSQMDGRHAGALIVGPTTGGVLRHDGPNIIVLSYRKSDKRGRLLINGVSVANYRTDRGEILNGNLQIGSAGAGTGTTPALNACFAELLVIAEPIEVNASLTTQIVTDYLKPRYGVA